MNPFEDFFKAHPKLSRIGATRYFHSFQEILHDRQEIILDTMRDVVNYELWVASGVGCSICNPYYHEKFDAMGRDGLFFVEVSYCANFFKNSANYLNTFRNMRFIQHNINVILNFLKINNEFFGTMNDVTNFRQIEKTNFKPVLNPHNLWKFGVNFGVEYSAEKLLSQRAKVNNCIEELNNKNYSAECQDICTQTNPPNEVTIAGKQFVINLLMCEYIIDTFWEKTFPGKYTDSVKNEFPQANTDIKTISEEEKNEIKTEDKSIKKPQKTAASRRRMFRRQNTITIPDNVDINDSNNKIVTSNDFNLIKYYFEKMMELSFKSVFPFIRKSAEGSKNYVDFEKLSTSMVSFKASWIPFPNAMNYERVRVSYESEYRVTVSLTFVVFVAFLFKMFN